MLMKSFSLGDDAIRVMRGNQSAVPRIGDVQHQRQRVATGSARGVVDLGAGASGDGHARPSAAKRSAMARPMPRPPPVTSATRGVTLSS